MWNGGKVALIFPTYNEKDSIRQAICDVLVMGVVDEVLVVNNNAVEGTSAEVAQTSAREVFEPLQGYGAAIRRGFWESREAEYVLVSEPDGTFSGRDILKLLVYADDFDVVYGSRTVKELIWQGANMGLFLKWGNYAVAKLMEFLFNTTSLTDVGCTMRCVRRRALAHMEAHFTVNGSFFGPEMMLLSVIMDMKVIQLPVNYTRRVGHSSVTGDPVVAFFLGLRMIRLIVVKRLHSWFSPGSYPRFVR